MLRFTLLIASIILGILSSTATSFAKEWWDGSCKADITLFTMGVPSFVGRAAPAPAATIEEKIEVLLASPPAGQTAKETFEVGFRSDHPVGPARQVILKMIERGGWLAVKRKGTSALWSQVFVDEGGNCRRFEEVTVEKFKAPTFVVASLAEGNSVSAAAPAADKPGSSQGAGLAQVLGDGVDSDPQLLSGPELQAAIKTFPKPVLSKLVGYQKACRESGYDDAAIDSVYVSRKDYDGDGTLDILVDGNHAYCIGMGRERSIVGGGNNASDLMIFLRTSNGMNDVFSKMVGTAALLKYDGFAVLVAQVEDRPTTYLLLRNGAAQNIEGKPRGGEVVFRLTR